MKKSETIGFNIAAAVPIDRVGYVLKALFDNGCPPSSFDLKAIVGGGELNGHAVVEQPAVPRIVGRNHSKFKAADIRDAILAIMSESSGPIRRKDLFKAVCERLGEQIAQARLGTASTDLMKDGRIKSDGKGHYALTKAGRQQAEGA